MILIAQISDLHLVPDGRLCNGRVDTNQFARRAVAAINRLRTRPDAVLVTGDIIDTAQAEDYAVAQDILGRLEMPFYLAAGNHDISAGLKIAFPFSESIGSTLPDCFCYTADIGDIRLITLDSSVPGAIHGELSSEQLSFLDCELTRVPDRPVVIVVHHPPIRTGNQTMDRFALADPENFAGVLGRHTNVLRILCGHYHRAAFGAFANTTVAVAPATGHQLELGLSAGEVFGYNFEPPAYLLHRWSPVDGATTLVAMIEQYPAFSLVVS